MTVRLGSARAWRVVLGVLVVASFVAVVPLTVLSGQIFNALVAVTIGVPCAAVGWLVTRRQPGNPIGWLFLVTGVFMFLSTAGGDYGYYVYRLGHHLPLGAAGSALSQFWGPSLLLLGADILLFPDGTLASRLWRSALRIYAVAFALLILATCVAIAGALAAHPIRVDSTGGPGRGGSTGRPVRCCPGPAQRRVGWAVAGLHRPAGAELAAQQRGPAPAAEVAGQRRRRHDHLSVPGGVLQHFRWPEGTARPSASPGSGWLHCRCRSGWAS